MKLLAEESSQRISCHKMYTQTVVPLCVLSYA